MRKMYIPIWGGYPVTGEAVGLLEKFQGRSIYAPVSVLLELIKRSETLNLTFELRTEPVKMGEPIALPGCKFVASLPLGKIFALNETGEWIVQLKLNYVKQTWEVVNHIEL